MTDKKNDKKVQEVLKDQDLDKVTGGRAEMLEKAEDRKGPKQNLTIPHDYWLTI